MKRRRWKAAIRRAERRQKRYDKEQRGRCDRWTRIARFENMAARYEGSGIDLGSSTWRFIETMRRRRPAPAYFVRIDEPDADVREIRQLVQISAEVLDDEDAVPESR